LNPTPPRLLRKNGLPGEPRQERSRKRRSAIIDAALAQFRKRGYAATTVSDIAYAADVPVGAFYQHFRSKEQLLLFLMERLLADLERLRFDVQTDDVQGSIRNALCNAFVAEMPYAAAYRAWREAVLTGNSLSSRNAAMERWSQARIQRLFEALVRLPNARQDVDVSTMTVLFDQFFWALLARVTQEADDVLGMARCSADLIYHALIKD
jgi:AcrR family transcriptional regulator